MYDIVHSGEENCALTSLDEVTLLPRYTLLSVLLSYDVLLRFILFLLFFFGLSQINLYNVKNQLDSLMTSDWQC